MISPRGRRRRWCRIRSPQSSKRRLSLCDNVNFIEIVNPCPGSSPLLLRRQEEPKHDVGGAVWRPGVEAAVDPGMDIDFLETPETDLKELSSVVTRDVVAQVK